MTKNSTISEMILAAMKRLHDSGHKSVTRTILWNALKDMCTKEGSLKRASLSSCITSLIASKRLVIVPIQFDVQHFALPNTVKTSNLSKNIQSQEEQESEIDAAAEILLTFKDIYYVEGSDI